MHLNKVCFSLPSWSLIWIEGISYLKHKHHARCNWAVISISSFFNKEKSVSYRPVVIHCVVKLPISNAFEHNRNLTFIIFLPNLGPLVAVIRILVMLLMNQTTGKAIIRTKGQSYSPIVMKINIYGVPQG